MAFLLVSSSAQAFDPATDHKCVAYCDGGSAPSRGGGYAAPAPSGPSPAEIARRKRIAAGNAANDRGAAARKRGDLRAAVRYFEEAARLWPEDRKIQGNYWNAKGELAARDGNYAEAVSYYKSALRYYPGHKDITKRLNSAQMLVDGDRSDQLATKGKWDEALSYHEKTLALCEQSVDTWFCPTMKLRQQYLAAGQALSHQQWAKAGEALRAYVSEKMASPGNANLNKEEKDFFDFERSAADAIARGDMQQALKNYENMAQLEKKWAAEQGKDSPEADVMLLELRRQAALQAARQSQQKEQEQASNPNYPNPPPVYRGANTPRDYPDLANYTPSQHAAHNDNGLGNIWAQKGDWVQALLSYQKALTEDPDGPFSKTIKENLDIAMKHLNEERAKGTSAAAPPNPAATVPPATQVQVSKKPEEIADSNCTRWSAANGKSSRVCMDAEAHHYCEESDGKTVSRVSCQ